jgi:hypothetical protein
LFLNLAFTNNSAINKLVCLFFYIVEGIASEEILKKKDGRIEM